MFRFDLSRLATESDAGEVIIRLNCKTEPDLVTALALLNQLIQVTGSLDAAAQSMNKYQQKQAQSHVSSMTPALSEAQTT